MELAIDAELHHCRDAGFGKRETEYNLPEYALKDALTVLWRMAWREPLNQDNEDDEIDEEDREIWEVDKYDDDFKVDIGKIPAMNLGRYHLDVTDSTVWWVQRGVTETNLDIPRVINLFLRQSDPTQRCIKAILIFLAWKVEDGGKFLGRYMILMYSVWGRQCLGPPGRTFAYSLVNQVNTNLLAAIILCGVDNVLKRVTLGSANARFPADVQFPPRLDVIHFVETRLHEVHVLVTTGEGRVAAVEQSEQNGRLMRTMRFNLWNRLECPVLLLTRRPSGVGIQLTDWRMVTALLRERRSLGTSP